MGLFLEVFSRWRRKELLARQKIAPDPAGVSALQRLENQLGEKLFDRAGKDLMLTDAGRACWTRPAVRNLKRS
jgi:hypothetical protein